ncbi:replication initiation protein [Hymenobacter sp. BT186]|uniref:Replication initiation protein n=1 Tax=Hymenobacter telluris TaxID=2816474 RepID=A0A939F152_9BACT|nr:replication initiation protein [Hymenobacter telluris]MBO0360842.1 replication initiation protein [Hymenobacter telluris]MBW3376871.1 replication initiation protein [Hymenobacter norwichensis]
MSVLTTSPVHPLVVQHNALVNAQFSLSTTESRLFLAMLARISPQDTEFAKCQVDIHDIVEPTSNNYAHVRKMLDNFGGCKLRIEKLSPDGRRRQKRTFTVIPLVEYAEYREGGGLVEARFNRQLLPYLLELRDNFTKAQLADLIKLKSPSSFRIYWLLREYASFGKRTVPLEELKAILGLVEEYDRFNNFRVRVLDRAQKELADTDTAFTYKTIKSGREVIAIEFRFQHRLEVDTDAPPLVEWEEAVLATGITLSSLPQIKSRLAAGDYDLGYVRYVLDTVKSQVQAGKVKREGGAVFKALIDGYLLSAYHKEQQRHNSLQAKSKPKPKNTPAVATQLRRLNSELEDAHNSLNFVQTAVIYTDETRITALREVQKHIAQLEQQRQQLTA